MKPKLFFDVDLNINYETVDTFMNISTGELWVGSGLYEYLLSIDHEYYWDKNYNKFFNNIDDLIKNYLKFNKSYEYDMISDSEKLAYHENENLYIIDENGKKDDLQQLLTNVQIYIFELAENMFKIKLI